MEHVITALFNKRMESNGGSAREAVDMISGMTDRFALHMFQKSFVPRPWPKVTGVLRGFAMMKFAFLIMGDFDSPKDRAAIHGGAAQIIGVPSVEAALPRGRGAGGRGRRLHRALRSFQGGGCPPRHRGDGE